MCIVYLLGNKTTTCDRNDNIYHAYKQWSTYPWASCLIREIAGCACAGNAWNVFPATDFKGNRSLAIPVCIATRASRTCRDSCRDRLPVVVRKNVPCMHFRCMHSPQFCVASKRPLDRNTAYYLTFCMTIRMYIMPVVDIDIQDEHTRIELGDWSSKSPVLCGITRYR